MVQKAIHDNLKSWTRIELDCNRDEDGKTCREWLRERKALNLENKAKYPLGKKFYAELKAKFPSDWAPEQLLKPTSDMPIQESLLKAMIVYKATGARGPMLSCLATL
jgi:hypothetical protein